MSDEYQVANGRNCKVCAQPVIFAYMPGNPEPVDVLHTTNIGTHDHDPQVDITDIEDEIYGRPPEGWDE
jgi:hypothetical protein